MNISSLRMNYLCKVCAEPAAGFHFGAFTCEGCKSFFGRTYNNLSQIHECKNGGQCVINKQNRTSCKACRLRKCLIVGMSKSGSRYGRRSNWFRIHYALQEQAASMNRSLEGCGNINLQLNASQATIPRLSPGTYNEEEGTMSSPALSSPDSNTSDTSVDVEPMRIASYASMQSPQTQQLSNLDQDSLAVMELNRRTRDAMVTVGGRGNVPPVSGADFIAGLSFFGIHSGLSLLETSHLYQRLYPSLMSTTQGNVPAQDQLPHAYEPPSPANSPALARTSPLNPPSPSQSLPPPNTEREQFSNPPSPQSLPAQPFPDRGPNSPSSCSSSPSLAPPRKRTADTHPEQDAPIDLSVKRPKLGGLNHPVSLPDLTPIAMPFNFLHLQALASPAVPLDLTSNA